MVGDRLAPCDVEAAPSFALFGFEALEEVEEGDGGDGVFWVGDVWVEVLEHCPDGPGRDFCGR